jgi:hypothetical protein
MLVIASKRTSDRLLSRLETHDSDAQRYLLDRSNLNCRRRDLTRQRKRSLGR